MPASVAAIMPVDVSELSTLSTPEVSPTTSSTKRTLRESSAKRHPDARSTSRFGAPPAVPTSEQPSDLITCEPARPTPPDAAWMSTLEPGRARAALTSAASTVTNTVGQVAASAYDRLGGLANITSSSVCTCVPRQPGARP